VGAGAHHKNYSVSEWLCTAVGVALLLVYSNGRRSTNYDTTEVIDERKMPKI
jgi:hypothetical protein